MIIHAIHLIITRRTWPWQITNMWEYIYLYCCRTALAPRMSIQTLSSTVIRNGHFYYRWIRINETNTARVSDRRNSMAFIFHMEYMKLAKTVYRNIRWQKVRHRILMWAYWEYSSHLRRKLGEGKYLFSLPNRENHFFISLLHFC